MLQTVEMVTNASMGPNLSHLLTELQVNYALQDTTVPEHLLESKSAQNSITIPI
jgi:hypothetical protein